MREVISVVHLIVRSREDPPAPYVTETKSGAASLRAATAFHKRVSPTSSLGGKNSTENVGALDI